nr:DUF4127 family protein [Deinococcota bacterium]
LHAQAGGADLLILSLETLCLGGMIPARRVDDSLAEAEAYLDLLPQLKAINPQLKILAGGVVVRVAHDDDPVEEKPYYGTHGPALRAFSEASDRYRRHRTEEDKARLEAAKKGVPEDILQDWLATRERNHVLHHKALALVQGGVIDHLCLTLDDTSSYGLAAIDRRALEALTDDLALWPKVDIYPGADEVPAVLLARALQVEPAKVYVSYSGSSGAAAGLLYEDRAAGELVKAQLRAARCLQVGSPAEADIILAVNTPATKQAHAQPDYATVDTAERHLPGFVDAVAGWLEEGRRVSIADIAYPNGAELRLMKLLSQRLDFAALAGFAAWNTAGNTLGSAIAMAVIRERVDLASAPQRDAWFSALFNRFVDDWLYQSVVREEVRGALGNPSPFDLGGERGRAEGLIGAHLEPLAQELWQEHFAASAGRLLWRAPKLAWPRLFTGVFPFGVSSEASLAKSPEAPADDRGP